MTTQDLAKSYLVKARARLKALAVLRDEGAHSDVVPRGAGAGRAGAEGHAPLGGAYEPPKLHDVSPLLVEHRARFVADVGERLGRAAEISQRLRHDRELAFYGDIDFIPTEQYSGADAVRAFEDAAWTLRLAEDAITRGRRP